MANETKEILLDHPFFSTKRVHRSVEMVMCDKITTIWNEMPKNRKGIISDKKAQTYVGRTEKVAQLLNRIFPIN